MDFKVSTKETRLQPGVGMVDVYVPDVFDLFLIEEDGVIMNVEMVDDLSELEQASLFATIKQMGSDPVDPFDGVRWAEVMLGELSPAVAITEAKEAVRNVSTNCVVDFFSTPDENGNELLNYTIKVVAV